MLTKNHAGTFVPNHMHCLALTLYLMSCLVEKSQVSIDLPLNLGRFKL